MSRKIKVVSVQPTSARESFTTESKCFVAVSMNSEFFQKYWGQLLFQYITERFEECVVLIADELHRFDLAMLIGFGPSEALAGARGMGDAMEAEIRMMIPVGGSCKFKVKRWHELSADPRVDQSLTALQTLAARSVKFSSALERTAHEYLKRVQAKGAIFKLPLKECLELSRAFILEELACYNVLAEDGYCVDIYPGTYLPVLDDIAQGRIPEAPAGLRAKINVRVRTVQTG
jgi:tRNA-dependent cyclodipeptide synthase